jgi:hypothetical protein
LVDIIFALAPRVVSQLGFRFEFDEKLRKRYSQGLRQLVGGRNRDGLLAAFDRTNVGTMQSAPCGKLLLRPSGGMPQLADEHAHALDQQEVIPFVGA